ncbi:unnamed protein product, partial [Symbiodinium sp. CCMP2456]
AMVKGAPGVGEALLRGKKLKECVKLQKQDTSSKPSKPSTKDVPLDTEIGCGNLTLQMLMKQEKLSYHDAVAVFRAFEDSQQPKTPAPAVLSKDPGVKSRKAEQSQSHPKAKDAPQKSAKKPKKEGKPIGILRKNACDDLSRVSGASTTPTEIEEAGPKVTFRIKSKRPAEDVPADAPPPKRKPVPSATLALTNGDDEDEQGPGGVDDGDDVWWNEENVWLEYDLWRKGYPQLSEMSLAGPTKEAPKEEAPIKDEVKGEADSQVSGTSFLAAQDIIREKQRLAGHAQSPVRMDSNVSEIMKELGPSASQLGPDVSALLQKVQQLEKEKDELRSQISASSIPAERPHRPQATPVRADIKAPVFETPSPKKTVESLPGSGISTTSSPDHEKPSIPDREKPSIPDREKPSIPDGEKPSIPDREKPSIPDREKPSSIPDREKPNAIPDCVSNGSVSVLTETQPDHPGSAVGDSAGNQQRIMKDGLPEKVNSQTHRKEWMRFAALDLSNGPDAMNELCAQIHAKVHELKLCQGQAKGLLKELAKLG